MSTSADVLVTDTGCAGTVTLPADPTVSNHYHFGMLLGVADLDADQGYHRGKGWLHQSWLHGAGVVWGLGVSLDVAHRELRVDPGLAVTAAGREALLDRVFCVDVGQWFDQRRPDDLAVEVRDDGARVFTVHVVITPRSCLDRAVPAISEPCSGGDTGTAWSRVVETAGLELVAGPAPEHDAPFGRVRQFVGLLPATDAEVVGARAEVAAAAEADRAATRLRWLRAFSADDVIARGPDPAGASPYPAAATAGVVLAQVEVVLLDTADPLGAVTDTGADATTVQNRVRPAHLATSTIQELVAGDLAPGAAPDPDPGPPPPSGPRLDPATLTLVDAELRVAATAPLEAGTVVADTVRVTALDGGGWTDVEVTAVALDADGRTVVITLAAPVAARPVRLVVAGGGPRPVLGTGDQLPLAGAVGDPAVGPDQGTDAIVMLRSTP